MCWHSYRRVWHSYGRLPLPAADTNPKVQIPLLPILLSGTTDSCSMHHINLHDTNLGGVPCCMPRRLQRIDSSLPEVDASTFLVGSVPSWKFLVGSGSPHIGVPSAGKATPKILHTHEQPYFCVVLFFIIRHNRKRQSRVSAKHAAQLSDGCTTQGFGVMLTVFRKNDRNCVSILECCFIMLWHA